MADARVFISHSHADRDFAVDLNQVLVKHDAEVFLDQEHIEAGDPLPSRLKDGIRWCNRPASMVQRCEQVEVGSRRMGLRLQPEKEDSSLRAGRHSPVRRTSHLGPGTVSGLEAQTGQRHETNPVGKRIDLLCCRL